MSQEKFPYSEPSIETLANCAMETGNAVDELRGRLVEGNLASDAEWEVALNNLDEANQRLRGLIKNFAFPEFNQLPLTDEEMEQLHNNQS